MIPIPTYSCEARHVRSWKIGTTDLWWHKGRDPEWYLTALANHYPTRVDITVDVGNVAPAHLLLLAQEARRQG